MPTAAPTVVVAVLTFRRPADLAELLEALALEVEAAREVEASILVVDNDPSASARQVVGASTARAMYVNEPRPGIAAARNRALAESRSQRLLVFIDDDERPQPGWLLGLVRTWQTTGAAAVVGPVLSTFVVEPSPWIVAGGFFRRRRLPTGTEVSAAATNNLLLDLDVIRTLGVRFDDRFGLSGGSDTLFTRQLHQQGGRLVWCDEAVVLDVVPAARATSAWVLRRALRMGNSASRTSIALAPTALRRLAVRVRMTVAAVARVIAGAARLAVGWMVGSARHHARGARTLARGLGMIGGAWGTVVVEYRRHSASEPARHDGELAA